MKKELYEWQEICLQRWFANHGRGMVQAVTGSGKTLLALTAADRIEKTLHQKLHVKIVVPTNALMHQWSRELQEFLSGPSKERQHAAYLPEGTTECAPGNIPPATPENAFMDIGLRGSGHKAPPNCKYMIYVVNSARYELARQILSELKQGDAVFLIADECHHYASGQNQLIFEFLPYIKEYEKCFFSLGLSATLPGGQAGRDLKSALGRKIYTYGITEAAFQRTISPYDIYHISLSFQAWESEEYQELSEQMSFMYQKLLKSCPALKTLKQTELFEMLRSLAGNPNPQIARAASTYMALSYKRKSLVCLASARTACAFDLVQKLDKQEKIIIFGERISQAEELYRDLQEYEPERIGRYHSKMGKQANKNVLERFRTGAVRILIACKAIDEGIDVPDASVGIILSSTSTQRQRTQRLGRIIRKKDGNCAAKLYYLHIEETTEDSCFLPERKEQRLFELSYNSAARTFTHPAYDRRADALLAQMLNAGIGEEKMQEIKRCLQLGCVRSDWKLCQNDIDGQIQKAKYASDKNYWICMKKIHNFHE